MSEHSEIVGGSSAKRVINCPGSVKLCQKVPNKDSSYAKTGRILHDIIFEILTHGTDPQSYIGRTYEDQVLDEELLDTKINQALLLLDNLDPQNEILFRAEQKVSFGDFLPGVFGSVDFVGRSGKRVIILDWKFGDGGSVEAEENEQMLFYAAAAKRTASLSWIFEDAADIECVIIQPPYLKRWVTSLERLTTFETQLKLAVDEALSDNASFALGDHCRWCSAKIICPLMTIEARDIAERQPLLTPDNVSYYLDIADILKQWTSDIYNYAYEKLEMGEHIPNYKLVPKRGRRCWTNEERVITEMQTQGLSDDELFTKELLSPAQLEKVLKKRKLKLSDDLVAVVSSGSTIAKDSDPRSALETSSSANFAEALKKIS